MAELNGMFGGSGMGGGYDTAEQLKLFKFMARRTDPLIVTSDAVSESLSSLSTSKARSVVTCTANNWVTVMDVTGSGILGGIAGCKSSGADGSLRITLDGQIEQITDTANNSYRWCIGNWVSLSDAGYQSSQLTNGYFPIKDNGVDPRHLLVDPTNASTKLYFKDSLKIQVHVPVLSSETNGTKAYAWYTLL